MDIPTTAIAATGGLQWKERMLSANASPKEQAEQLGSEFEGILIRQFLDQALKPMDPEAGFFGAKGSPMYEHLIKDTLASSITKSGSLGFSSVLQAQLFPDHSTIEEGADSQ